MDGGCGPHDEPNLQEALASLLGQRPWDTSRVTQMQTENKAGGHCISSVFPARSLVSP